MMRMAVVTTGTATREFVTAEDGLRIPSELLALAGVLPGDRVELHFDGTMLVLVPACLLRPLARRAERSSATQPSDTL